MKSSAKAGFTLVELLIGVVMMSIVIAGIAFTVSSGFGLFTKADSNAVVIGGVRFTADSFKRTVAPMLNVTSEIEILPVDSVIPAPASISDDVHYVFLSNDSVVHRNSQGDHALEGSEYIDNIEFSIPVSSADTQENYIIAMDIHGVNADYPKAKLDLRVESALYNRPEKTGTAVSGYYSGSILKIRASLYLDRLDLYDNDTKIKINGLTMHKGTNIEAVYDIINQTGTSVPMSDDSIIEWFISGSVSADLPITEDIPNDTNKNENCWQLVYGGSPVTGKVLNTVDTFHLDTGATVTDWEVGVIRCRVTPVVKSQGGGSTVTGISRWSDYVIIKSLTAPSDEFENILGVLGRDEDNGTGDVFFTEGSTYMEKELKRKDDLEGKNPKVFKVISGMIQMTIESSRKKGYGSLFVAQLKYDKFDNDRIYAAWAAGRESASDIPSFMTVTNYSVVFDSKIKNDKSSSTLFLSTRSNNSDFKETDINFEDVGYAAQYMPYIKPYGFLVSKFRKGREIVVDKDKVLEYDKDEYDDSKIEPLPLGIFNETLSKNTTVKNSLKNYYEPLSLNNSEFTFDDKWTERYRVLHTVLEYYDEIQGKTYPRHIFRVRFLKRTDNWDVLNPGEPLSEIKKRDPWCIGPKFYASEPMWFGDFVGSPNTTPNNRTTTVKAKNYYYTTPQTATLNRRINIATKIFYALKPPLISPGDVLRKRVMNARAGEKYVNGNDIKDDDDKVLNISDNRGGTELSKPEGSRYVGVRGVIKGKDDNDDFEENALTIYGLDFVPGFSINEIRSIMPENGKLYSLEETIPESELLKIQDKDWYKSYKNIIATSSDDINKKVFGTSGKSDGSGDNGSWYYQNAGSDGGVYDLQHIKGTCNCPLHNELFKWFGGQ